MEIIRVKNKYFENLYDYILVQGDKRLYIDFPGVMDSCWLMADGKPIWFKEKREITFEITKENYELYSLFENLYEEIVSGKPYGMDEDFKNTYEYRKLVDENKNITWISDNAIEESEDRVIISKQEDKIVLKFVRNDIISNHEYKSNRFISVRFRNNGSRYGYFYTSFQNLYNKMQDIDPEYHQYHIEEYEYLKRRNNKTK